MIRSSPPGSTETSVKQEPTLVKCGQCQGPRNARRADSCPWGDHRLTRERGKWPKLGRGVQRSSAEGLWKDKEGPFWSWVRQDEKGPPLEGRSGMPGLHLYCLSVEKSSGGFEQGIVFESKQHN